ncbi:MAG: hypothetical protein M3069_33325 [Chloroflexota bacterium]|nr:hypothetical protein [Chloroflexota bacterium]
MLCARFADDAAERILDNEIAQICPHDYYVYVENVAVTASARQGGLAEYRDWDVAVLTDGFIADSFPVQPPPTSTAFVSPIETIRGFGESVFFSRGQG